MDKTQIIVSTEDKDKRIDAFLSQQFSQISRTQLQNLIKEGHITVNHAVVKTKYKVMPNDVITITIPEPEVLEIVPENIALDIIYEDQDIIIVNKAKDMVVHPSPGHYAGTLVNALMYHCQDNLSSINGIIRPGIVHRIDKDTTGLLVVCKNNHAHMFMSNLLKDHNITRKYHAIVHDNIREDEGTINTPISRHPVDRKKQAVNFKNGKAAVTHYKVLERIQNKYTYIECELETGRTHQIRVHMSSINHSILGDTTYGSKTNFHLQGQTLHAKILGFIHPSTHEYMEFQVPLPEYFEEMLIKLRKI